VEAYPELPALPEAGLPVYSVSPQADSQVLQQLEVFQRLAEFQAFPA
jgi:hypothetical protein